MLLTMQARRRSLSLSLLGIAATREEISCEIERENLLTDWRATALLVTLSWEVSFCAALPGHPINTTQLTTNFLLALGLS
jgi:hypothetical protein